METYATKASEIQRRWYVIDAEGQVMGRLASEVAALLRGKWKPAFTPHLDVGDHVVVLNAAKIRLTGTKLIKKTYFRHSGYLGSERFIGVRERLDREPAELVRGAIWGMVPHNRLGRQIIRKLKVYPGAAHPHEAQRPIPYKLGLHGKGFPAQADAGGTKEA